MKELAAKMIDVMYLKYGRKPTPEEADAELDRLAELLDGYKNNAPPATTDESVNELKSVPAPNNLHKVYHDREPLTTKIF